MMVLGLLCGLICWVVRAIVGEIVGGAIVEGAGWIVQRVCWFAGGWAKRSSRGSGGSLRSASPAPSDFVGASHPHETVVPAPA